MLPEKDKDSKAPVVKIAVASDVAFATDVGWYCPACGIVVMYGKRCTACGNPELLHLNPVGAAAPSN